MVKKFQELNKNWACSLTLPLMDKVSFFEAQCKHLYNGMKKFLHGECEDANEIGLLLPLDTRCGT